LPVPRGGWPKPTGWTLKCWPKWARPCAFRPRLPLYLAAFIASRYDPTLKAFRKRLQDAGKPTKTALIATARKLVTILNAMMKYKVDYQNPELI